MRTGATTVRYIRALSRALAINPILSLCYSLLATTKTAHYAKEFVQLSRSKSLSRVASYCRRVPSAFWTRLAGIFLAHRETLKLSLFKLVRVSQAFPFRVPDLCRIPFKSCKTPLSRIEIECLGYLFAFATTLVSCPFSPMKFISKQGARSAANV